MMSRQSSQGNLASARRDGLPAAASTQSLRIGVHPASDNRIGSTGYGHGTMLSPASTSAFDLPGHSLFLSDPHRLSVLSLTIDATTSITQAAPPAVLFSQGLSIQEPRQAGPAEHAQRLGPPPSSRRISHNVASKRASLAAPEVTPRHGPLRPKSVEIGMRAKEAFNELGRRAREAAGNLDRGMNVEALSHVTKNLNPDAQRTAAAAGKNDTSAPEAGSAEPRPPTSEGTGDSSPVRVRRRTTAKLQSLTFGRDSRLTSSVVPLDLKLRSDVLDADDESGSKDYGPVAASSRDGRSRTSPRSSWEAVSFVADPSISQHAGSLGTFSSDTGDAVDEADRAPFDPTRLLLKVEPPAEQARRVWAQRAGATSNITHWSGDETHEVDLRFRLRLCASASANADAPSTPVSAKSTSGNVFGRAQASNSSSSPSASSRGLEEVLFVSADSSQKLVDAIEMVSSALVSAEAALLEGVSRLVVNPARSAGAAATRGPRDCDFEWKWKPLQRLTGSDGLAAKGHGTGKCCCAFVELDPGRTRARVLAAFQFWVEIPPPRAQALTTSSGPRKPTMMPSDSLALIAALNQDIDRADLFALDGRASTPAAVEVASDSSQAIPALRVDHTEISLNEIESDSPVLRAAVANLERRTATLKRQAKTALKAATEARLRILASMDADDALDEAMRDVASLVPDTLLRLRQSFGDHARERTAQYRREHATMLEQNVERPLAQIVEQCRVAQAQVKDFEAESKSYYSQTQKWLSSRVAPDGAGSSGFSTGSNGGPISNGDVERGGKQERADEKQRLRQLRFDFARLDLFRVFGALHGGHAELELAKCALRMAQWQASAPTAIWGPSWPGVETSATLLSIVSGVEAAGSADAILAASIGERCSELLERIHQTEASLSKAGGDAETTAHPANDGIETGGDASAYVNGTSRSDYGGAKGAKQQAGQKIRNFFSGLNVAKQGAAGGSRSHDASANSTPPVPSAGGSARSKDSGEPGIAADIKRRVSLKYSSKSRGQTTPSTQADPFRPPPSFNAQLGDQQQRGQHEPPASDSQASSRAAVELSKSPLLEHVSVANEYLFAHASALREAARLAGSPKQQSAAKSSSEASDEGQHPPLPRDAPGPADEAPAAPSGQPTAGLGIGGLPPKDPQVTASPAPSYGERTRAVPRQIAPGQERKKEGVLWVMSKPVSGPAGSDAPRAVNRSGHWRECWVVLSGSGHIGEYADWKDAKVLEPSNPLIDLRFATVRDARGVDRRFTFEVVTRDSRRFFQAPDEATMREWTKAIAKAIESLLNGTSSVRKIDRAVRATPFSVDGALQAKSVLEEGDSDEFGVLAGHGDLAAAAQRPLSQSMVDLTGGVKEARKYSEPPSSYHGSRRRGGGHASTMSESYVSPVLKQLGSKDDKPKRSSSKHERGISNKTPIYGYLGANGSAIGSSDHGHAKRESNYSEGLSSSSCDADYDFDRRIEEMVMSSFGAPNYASSSSNQQQTPSSPLASGAGRLHFPQQQRNVQQASATSTTSNKMALASEIIEISRRPENSLCADCRTPDPRWAAWALANEPCCIFICISCSGVHRSLGVHISKVKSVDLDDWTDEQVDAARKWGNARANELWEHSKPAGLLPAEGDRRAFWKTKYTDAAWKKKKKVDDDTPTATTRTPQRTPRISAPAAMAPTPDASTVGFDWTPTRAPKVRTASGNQQQQQPAPMLERHEPAPLSPRPSGPRPLPPSRSTSFAEPSSPSSVPIPVARSRQASESSRSPTKSTFGARPGFSSRAYSSREGMTGWPAVQPIDVEASHSQSAIRGDRRGDAEGLQPETFFVNDLSSTSPTTYESAAQEYYPRGVRLHLGLERDDDDDEDEDVDDDADDDGGLGLGLVGRA